MEKYNFSRFLIFLLLFAQILGCRDSGKGFSDNNILIRDKSDKYDLSKSEKEYLNRVIDSMYALDQGKRYDLIAIDSLYGVNKIKYFHRKEFLGPRYNEYQNVRDSLWKVTASIDESNTQKLIAITKKYGFPNNKRLGVYMSKAYFILVHAPRDYFDKIRSLINKEYKEGRISEYKKEYIFWHINGRNGLPPMNGKNGQAVWH